MKTDFQPEEVLTAEDLNANFTECAEKADAEHSHNMLQIEGLATAMTNKADVTDLNALETRVNGKANANHTQAISTITGLQSELDGKVSSDNIYKSLYINESNGTITIGYNEIGSVESLDNITLGIYLVYIYYGELGILGGENGGGILIMRTQNLSNATQIINDGTYLYKRTRSLTDHGIQWSAWTKTAILQ